MRLFITGGSGLLGSALLPLAQKREFEVVAPRSSDFDITSPEAVARLASGDLGSFDWVLNLAAYTKVDLAETNREEATGLNAIGPGYLASACEALGARLFHFSTDYVFDGTKTSAYVEEDEIHPIQFYGETKAEGERAVLESTCGAIVARVSWLYGPHGPCFPRWIVDAYLAGKPLRVVSDQYGVPSSTAEVSRMVLDLLQRDVAPGVYHVAGVDSVSRLEYAQAALRAYFLNHGLEESAEIEPVPSSEFPTPARRPSFSVLSVEKVGRLIQPHMALADCLNWL